MALLRHARAALVALGLAALAAAPAARAGAPPPEAELAAARAHAAAGRWQQAASAARSVAVGAPRTDAGRAGVTLYLEAIDQMGSRAQPPRPEVFDALAPDVPMLLGLYCYQEDLSERPEPCLTLVKLRRDLARLGFQHQGESRAKIAERLAEIERAVWTDAGEALCSANHPACQGMDRTLYAAARAYKEAGRLAKAIALWKTLANPAYHLHTTEFAMKGLYDIGQAFDALAIFDMAADWYERLAREARETSKMEEAAEALDRAVTLRLALGQDEQAGRDADLFARNYGAKRAEAAARLAVRVAAHDAQADRPRAAERRLSSAMGRIDHVAALDVRIVAHALLGRVAVALGDMPKAAAEYGRARAAWKDPERAAKRILEDGDPRRLVDALEAVGEAVVFFADRARADADAIALPPYQGAVSEAPLLRYVREKVAPWMKKKRAAIERADEAYLAVLRIEPEAPPRWAIAAAARAGGLWAAFARDLGAVPQLKGPIPGRGGLTYEELRAAYVGVIDSNQDVLHARAKAAFQQCVALSTRYTHFDESSRSCETWLAAHYPAEWHAFDDAIAMPLLASPRFQARPVERSVE